MGMRVLLSGTGMVIIGDCPKNAVGVMLTTAVETKAMRGNRCKLAMAMMHQALGGKCRSM